jgi:hypothetical protein
VIRRVLHAARWRNILVSAFVEVRGDITNTRRIVGQAASRSKHVPAWRWPRSVEFQRTRAILIHLCNSLRTGFCQQEGAFQRVRFILAARARRSGGENQFGRLLVCNCVSWTRNRAAVREQSLCVWSETSCPSLCYFAGQRFPAVDTR